MTKNPTPQTRGLVLLRDAGRCVWCGRPWGDRLNLHHRLLRSHGTNNSPENLISLCGSGTTGCHGAIHANPSRARDRGHIVASWDDPAETPILTWQGLLLLDHEGHSRKYVPAGGSQKPLAGDFAAWSDPHNLGADESPSDFLSRGAPLV